MLGGSPPRVPTGDGSHDGYPSARRKNRNRVGSRSSTRSSCSIGFDRQSQPGGLRCPDRARSPIARRSPRHPQTSPSPVRIAISTGESGSGGAVRSSGSVHVRPGWATNLGPVPRCRSAACSRNGWQRYTSPAWPVASASRRSWTFGSHSFTSPKNIPSSPAGASAAGTSRCDPTLIRVGASSSPTSENKNSISSERPSERTFTQYWSPREKLPSMCQPSSPGSPSTGNRTGVVPPRPSWARQRPRPTSWSNAASSLGV